MTDEIRITRRVALPDKYEYYEIQWTTTEDHIEVAINMCENKVAYIRELLGKPETGETQIS